MKPLSKFRTFFEDGAMGAGAVAANATGDSANMAMPPSMNPMTTLARKKYRMFEVDSETFRRFQCGRARFERWSKYLDLNNDSHKEVYNYAKQNRDHMLVLRDSSTGALRAIRRKAANE